MNQAPSIIADRFIALLLHRHFVPGCLAAHAILRLALIVLLPVSMTSDAAWYLLRGVGIAAGNGYSEGGLPTAFWPVGYPAFLALVFLLFGPHLIAAQIANVVLSIGTALLCLLLAREMRLGEAAARLALLLLTIYPNNIAYSSLTLSETLFTALVLLGSYVCIRYWSWRGVLLGGIVFGLAALTKPQVLFFPLMVVGLRLRLEPPGARMRTVALGLALYSAMAAPLAPWSLRNFFVFHEIVLISTNGGSTLLTGNNPTARGGYTEDDALVDRIHFSVADQVAADKRARNLAVQWIREHPGRFLTLMPLKVWHLWAPDGEAEWAYQGGYSRYREHVIAFRLSRLLNQAFYVAVLIAFAASVSIAALRGVPSPWFLLGYGFAAYLTLISIVFSGQSRFHFPFMPWVMVGAAWSIMTLLRRWSGDPQAIQLSQIAVAPLGNRAAR